MSKLLWSYFSSIWCCDSSWSLTSLPLGWHGQLSEKTLGNDQGGWAWLQNKSRKPKMTFSFHNVFYLTSSSSTNPIVSKQGAVLGRAVCNLALWNTAFLYLGQQQIHPFSACDRAVEPSHACPSSLQRLWTVYTTEGSHDPLGGQWCTSYVQFDYLNNSRRCWDKAVDSFLQEVAYSRKYCVLPNSLSGFKTPVLASPSKTLSFYFINYNK